MIGPFPSTAGRGVGVSVTGIPPPGPDGGFPEPVDGLPAVIVFVGVTVTVTVDVEAEHPDNGNIAQSTRVHKDAIYTGFIIFSA